MHIENVLLAKQTHDQGLTGFGRQVHIEDGHGRLVLITLPVDASGFKSMIPQGGGEPSMTTTELERTDALGATHATRHRDLDLDQPVAVRRGDGPRRRL